MLMPFITVVIPLYNKEQSVERAIHSVLSQSYSDFELIVVDDGSTDQSYHVSGNIKDKRIKLLQQRNQGVSAARNAGVQQATSEYIAFLDADDCYHSDFLERIVGLINDYPSAALFSCRFQLVDEAGNTFTPAGNLPTNFRGALPCFFTSFKQNRSLIHPSCMAVNKSAFMTVGGFPVGKSVGEDLQLMLMIALYGKVVTDYQIASTVFRNAENRTANRLPAQASCHITYFLNNTDWQASGLARANKALLSFMYHNTLLHIAGACLNEQRPLARHYARLLWPHHKLYSLCGYGLSFTPTILLDLIKRQRNHG